MRAVGCQRIASGLGLTRATVSTRLGDRAPPAQPAAAPGGWEGLGLGVGLGPGKGQGQGWG